MTVDASLGVDLLGVPGMIFGKISRKSLSLKPNHMVMRDGVFDILGLCPYGGYNVLWKGEFPSKTGHFSGRTFNLDPRKELQMRMAIRIGLLALGASLSLFSFMDAALCEEVIKSEVPAVVARVNGKAITAAQFDKMRRQLILDYTGKPGEVKDPKLKETIKKHAVERLISLELLNQRAEELNIQISKEEVDEKIKEVQQRVGGKEAFEKALKVFGFTVGEFRDDVAHSLRIKKLLKKEVLDKITITDQQAQEFYKNNPQAFEIPEQVRARHIIIKVPKEASDAEKNEARKKIEEAARRIKGGEEFEKVAAELSQDSTAKKGGDLGYFTRGQMIKEFEEAAFSLKKGQISDIVETPYGFHIIKLEDRKPPRTMPFEEAKPRIVSFLKDKEGDMAVRLYLEKLKSKAKIERTPF
jgi:peptidyl-prolyl cis-trans isomerase C